MFSFDFTIAKQYAFGLKSDPNETIQPDSSIFLAGGLGSCIIIAVVGNRTPTVSDLLMSSISLSLISSR